MYCPECGAEYRPEFERCADCGVEPIREAPAVPAREELTPATVVSASAVSSPRPLSVTAAIWLAVAGLVAESLVTILFEVRGHEYFGPYGARWQAVVGFLLVFLVMYGVTVGLLLALAFRRRWAYVLFLLVYVLALVSSLVHARDTFIGAWPWPVAWNAGMFLVRVVVVVLLLLPASRSWYRREADAGPEG